MMLSNHFILCCPLLLLTSLFPSIMVFSNEIKELCAQLLICAQLFDPMDCSPPCSSVHGISQARILEHVVISSSRGSSQSRDRTYVSCIGRWVLYHWATREALMITETEFNLPYIGWFFTNSQTAVYLPWVYPSTKETSPALCRHSLHDIIPCPFTTMIVLLWIEVHLWQKKIINFL